METHAHPHYHRYYRAPALGGALAVVLAVLLCAAILSMQDWWLAFPGMARGKFAQPAPAENVCYRCGVIESVRTMDHAEMSLPHNVAIRGFGDDLMSVLGVVVGALTGNKPRRDAHAAPIHEVTVRFEDGSSRVVKIVGGRNWELGDRVKVIQGRLQADG